MTKSQLGFTPPSSPLPCISIGVTGHREANEAFRVHRAEIEQSVGDVFNRIDIILAKVRASASGTNATRLRLHTLLVEGVDQLAARQALARDWDIVAPLPFGRVLNTAINAHPRDVDEATALLSGEGPCSQETLARAAAINGLAAQAHCFELGEADVAISELFLATCIAPTDIAAHQAFSFAASERVALAAQILVEQSDLIIGIWDGINTSYTGGTGHTIALALSMGTPVLWINASKPQEWLVLQAPEELASRDLDKAADPMNRALNLARIETILAPSSIRHSKRYMDGALALSEPAWRPKSHPVWHAYRRVEALFGGSSLKQSLCSLTQSYERPDEIALGSGKDKLLVCADLLSTHPRTGPTYVTAITKGFLERFAWADGISSRLSDQYRGGMVMNFLFSALAIVGGIAYLPLASADEKWGFALFELALLVAILTITFVGQGRRWHGRWFETRRVAEYLRCAPILVMLGVVRPIGRWPKGTGTSWPEQYARHSLRAIGLPEVVITSTYLRRVLEGLIGPHISAQIDYHRAKAKRLARTHHRLDQLSEWLFKLAVASVCAYLGLKLAGKAHVIDAGIATHLSKLFTFLGVLLPTFGGAISGIRFFGDFERFSAISDITAQKLEGIKERSDILLGAPRGSLTYAMAATLARATDDVVIAEIESWQAVFSGKQMTVPV
jgi:hypothetical protein